MKSNNRNPGIVVHLWSGRRWGSHRVASSPQAPQGWSPLGRSPRWCSRTYTDAPGSASWPWNLTSLSWRRCPPRSAARGSAGVRSVNRVCKKSTVEVSEWCDVGGKSISGNRPSISMHYDNHLVSTIWIRQLVQPESTTNESETCVWSLPFYTR